MELAKKTNTWKRSFRLGDLYITFSNCRVKKRIGDRENAFDVKTTDIKQQMYDFQGGACPVCRQHYKWKEMELHHVLPWSQFPELRGNRANLMLLCAPCHHEIHCDPYKNIRMMKAKAKELGVSLEEHFETRKRK